MRWLGGATEVRNIVAPKVPPPNVDALLLTALALLWPVPDPPYAEHTLVDQAVNAARHRTPAAADFINAVLRRFLREREALVAAARHQPLGAFNHPLWWIERLRHDWPTQWQALLAANNEHPPLTLRVNARRGSGEAYVHRLAAQGRAAHVLPDPALGGQAVVVEQPVPVTQLPGFAEGEVSVQDAAAQRAARLLVGRRPAARRPRARRLRRARRQDRAPAGAGRLRPAGAGQRPGAPGARAGHAEPPAAAARLQAGDARDTAAWWDGRPFDAILLDAPCSASGIVRRHPDVRWLRRPDDITALARLQGRDAGRAVAPAGAGRAAAVRHLFGLQERGFDADRRIFATPGAPGRRLDPLSPGHLLPLPDNANTALPGLAPALQDGFFYALIHKT